MKPEIFRTRSFVEEAARFIADSARDAIDERGHFRLSLSGGNTPRPVYQALSLLDCRWSKWIVTFGDERCVPPDDSESNYRMASESFLLVTSPGEVLRVKGEAPPEEAAGEYETALGHYAKKLGEKRYRHDLILLGLGDDGHTASLFPGTAALEERTRRVVANFVPKFNAWRLTFTFPLINQARMICFLVNAAKHLDLIEHVLKGDAQYPASRVNPGAGDVTWILGQ